VLGCPNDAVVSVDLQSSCGAEAASLMAEAISAVAGTGRSAILLTSKGTGSLTLDFGQFPFRVKAESPSTRIYDWPLLARK
jgi:hypothetical protein